MALHLTEDFTIEQFSFICRPNLDGTKDSIEDAGKNLDEFRLCVIGNFCLGGK